MFDILIEEWLHPPRINAPIQPLDVSRLTVGTASECVAYCKSIGEESLLLISGNGVPEEGVIDEILSSAATRHMAVYIHEGLMIVDAGLSDTDIASMNPMLHAHTLRVQLPGETLSDGEEPLHLYGESSAFESGDRIVKPRLVMTDAGDGIDLLCEETAGIMIYSVYEPFFERHKAAAGVICGIYTDRMVEFSQRTLPWTYDLVNDYVAFGGDLTQLTSFVSGNDGESREAVRIAALTASSRFSGFFADPIRRWAEERSLITIGPLPDELISTCAGALNVPVYTGDLLSLERDASMTALQCRTDAARLYGNRTGAYVCRGHDPDSVYREVEIGAAAGAGLYILPPEMAAPDYIRCRGIDKTDMRRMFDSIKRISSVGISRSVRSGTAIMCDDSVIPYSSAAKMRAKRAEFTIVVRSSLKKLASVSDGSLMIDRYSFDTLLTERRVRLSPQDVQLIGKFAVVGGRVLRGGFSEFAGSHGWQLHNGGEILTCDLMRCGVHHIYMFNPSDFSVSVSFPDDPFHSGCVFDVLSGNIEPLTHGSDGFVQLRISPGECVLVGWDPDSKPRSAAAAPAVREIVSLHCGENIVSYMPQEGDVCRIEFLGARGICRVGVGAHKARVLTIPPYVTDVTELLDCGENEITVSVDNNAECTACLRITSAGCD